MSYYAKEIYEVYDEIYPRASKDHVCSACEDIIPKGHYYTRIFIIFYGSSRSLKRCKKCQMIHLHLRNKGVSEGLWPDEKLNCGEEYNDHWGEEPPEHIAALAFATPNEVQSLPVPPEI